MCNAGGLPLGLSTRGLYYNDMVEQSKLCLGFGCIGNTKVSEVVAILD